MIPVQLISLFARLQLPLQRKEAAQDLARYAGVQEVLLFGKDAEIGVLLPAPGFAQTLRQGGAWQTFLGQCVRCGQHDGVLPGCHGEDEMPVIGIADNAGQCVLAFVGNAPDEQALAGVKVLLPLLGAKLVDERIALAAKGHAAAAREANRVADALNAALDTKRHELEEAVERVEAELARRHQVEDKLREADRRKDEFLAMLAHELKNPLAAISSAVELMAYVESGTAENREKVRQVIKRQTTHLAHLVEDLLDVSRFMQGKMTLRQDRLEVNSVISAALEMAHPFLQSRRHRLSVTLPQHEIWLTGDPVRLCQVIGNLLHNAGKFTPEGGEITLSARQLGQELVIAVRDNGIGISQEDIARIFEVFAQSRHAPGKIQEGLGIGLSLVKKLVELHGGQVQASSAGPDTGSLFELRLPVLSNQV